MFARRSSVMTTSEENDNEEFDYQVTPGHSTQEDVGGDASNTQDVGDLESAVARARSLDKSPPQHLASDHASQAPTKQIGHFRIEKLVGRGGMGLVFLARDTKLGRNVAVKVPRVDLTNAPEMRERFFQEARLTSLLQHPNLIPVYEADIDGSTSYIASAWCDGPDLAAWLASQQQPCDLKLAAEIVAILAETMEYCHQQGVLHRDLKPSNIMLDNHPNQYVEGDHVGQLPFIPKITDFGLARLVQDSLDQTESSLLLGTPQYMAPEQAECRSKDIGPATDIYALGVVLYEMLTGRPPHEGDTAIEILDQIRHQSPTPIGRVRPDVPRDLIIITNKCLQKRTEDRFASAAELAADLRRFCNDEVITASDVPLLKRINRWSMKPERVRDAAVFTITQNAVLISWVVALAVIVIGTQDERFATEGFSKFFLTCATLSAQCMIHAAAAYFMLRGVRFANWACLVMALALFGGITCVLMGAPPMLKVYENNEVAKTFVYGLLGMVALSQLILQLLATRQSLSRTV
jgi:serine/threonine protein kinase